MKRPTLYALIILAVCSFANVGCQKYLDAKSDKKLVVISSLQDMQALMDDYSGINEHDPQTPEAAADNYYVTDAVFAPFPDYVKNLYVWSNSHDFYGSHGNDWSLCYDRVYLANTILSKIGIVQRTPGNQDDWENVKGQALFLRSREFLFAVSIWSLAYDPNNAPKDLGIPLRLDPDFNEKSVRSSVQQSYDQIITDLKAAIPLLPVTPLHVLRASRPAACALLARTYLFMREYDSCFKYASECLQLKNDLMDYNVLPASARYPFSHFRFGANPEMIMFNMYVGDIVYSGIKIDSSLYNSYAPNDLRKSVFFEDYGDGTYSFKGSYYGARNLWDGIAVDEVYLMRAECYARKGDPGDAMTDLNTLLEKRWKTGSFIPYTASDAKDALQQILAERRKELVMRNIRWMDIKRLNKEGANITLKRIINGQIYTLPPNDPRFALPIPEEIIKLSGIPQNPY